MPDEDRYTYAEVLSRGGYLATVSDVSGSQHNLEVDILDEEGSIAKNPGARKVGRIRRGRNQGLQPGS